MRARFCTYPVLGLAVLASLILAPAVAVAQCDIPLIAQRVSTPPNVMILLDTSGSMNGAMFHADYDQTVIWSGDFQWNTTYKVSAAGAYTPDSFLGDGAPTSPSANLISGLHSRSGEYGGNYLNWVYFHATPEQRDAIPQVTRQQVANVAVKAVMNAAQGLRYGLAIFNGDDGAKIVANAGSDQAALELEVDNAVATGYTPTAESLVDLWEYFSSTGAGAPIEYDCQQNFVIVVTDGIPTRDLNIPAYIGDQDGDGREPGDCASVGFPEQGNADCSDYLDDVAYYMARNDARDDLEYEQTVSTYTIGFGVRSQLLAEAAYNGNGLYREAWDLNTLVNQLGNVVGDIVNRISAGAAVAVVSTESGDDNYLYRGKFMPGTWQGFLESYELPYKQGKSPRWEAGQKLYNRNPDSRVIWTSMNNALVEFTGDNADDLGYFMAPNGPSSGAIEADSYGPDLDNDFDSADRTIGPNYSAPYVGDIIDWVRGEDLDGYRDRGGWKLGDLVHSTPVVVGPPRGFKFDEDYMYFREAWKNRDSVVYVGANDGMLHAFDAETGEEKWAYIPRRVLGKLEMLAEDTYCHQTYVDLSPKAFDVEINGSWRTILVAGQRTGGDSYFAFDVTNPDSPQFLWETSVPSISSSFTEPVVLETTWGTALWVGSGPNPNGDAYTSLIRVDNGNILLNYKLGATIAGTNAATAPVAYDENSDGIADYVYQGDLGGNLYRWDITDDGVWYVNTMFSGTQPIQARPALARDEAGQLNVYFGTGKYTESSDLSDVQQQSFYCLREDGTTSTVYPSSLIKVTSSTTETEGWRGWYRDLEFGGGERVTQPAVVVEGVVYFTSFKPSSGVCSAGGDSYLYHIDYRNGTEVDSDEDGDLSDESVAESLGRGVASRPVVNLSAEELIVQTSDARLNVAGLLIGPQRIRVRAWRQQFETLTTNEVDPQTGQ